MSLTPYFYIEKRNEKTGKYEKVTLYDNNKKEVEVWSYNGTHDLFAMLDVDYSGEYDSIDGILHGIPADISEEVKAIIDDFNEEEEGILLAPVNYVNLADLKIAYFMNPIYTGSPLKQFINTIENYVYFAKENWEYNKIYSSIRIVYWVV